METIPSTAKEGNITNHYINVASPQSAKADTSVTDWLITFLIMIIPIVNIVMLFVWALSGSSDKPSRANWAKAALIWALIVIGLSTVSWIIFGVGVLALFSS